MRGSNSRIKTGIILFSFLLSTVCYGQEISVAGKVTAFGGIPLQNIHVEASKSKEKGITDSRGFFLVKCMKKDVLLIVAKPFKNQRVRVDRLSGDTLFIQLDFDPFTFELDQVIQKGYLNEEDLSAAQEYMDKNAPDYCMYSDIYQVIENCCPGVKVEYGSSPPSVSLYRSAHNVIYIVNGVENSFIDGISPCNIKSIKVIKDAADLSTYGSKGADGVIVISTK